MLNKIVIIFILFCGSAICSDLKYPLITIQTNYGPIEAVLFTDEAPKACENFIGLAENGAYDGTPFHRVIPDFMIQGGEAGQLSLGNRLKMKFPILFPSIFPEDWLW